MGYKKIGYAKPFLKIFQQFYDLGLDCHVQGTGRLIQYNKFWSQGNGPGNCYTLSLATGKLMRVAVRHVLIKAHLMQSFKNNSLPVFFVLAHIMNFQSFANNLLSC